MVKKTWTESKQEWKQAFVKSLGVLMVLMVVILVIAGLSGCQGAKGLADDVTWSGQKASAMLTPICEKMQAESLRMTMEKLRSESDYARTQREGLGF